MKLAPTLLHQSLHLFYLLQSFVRKRLKYKWSPLLPYLIPLFSLPKGNDYLDCITLKHDFELYYNAAWMLLNFIQMASYCTHHSIFLFNIMTSDISVSTRKFKSIHFNGCIFHWMNVQVTYSFSCWYLFPIFLLQKAAINILVLFLWTYPGIFPRYIQTSTTNR